MHVWSGNLSRFYRQKKGHATATQTGYWKERKDDHFKSQKSSSRTNNQSFQKEGQSAGQKWENRQSNNCPYKVKESHNAKQSQKGQNLHIKEE